MEEESFIMIGWVPFLRTFLQIWKKLEIEYDFRIQSRTKLGKQDTVTEAVANYAYLKKKLFYALETK